MKKSYYTAQNISVRSQKILHQVEKYRQRHPFEFKPLEAALLIVDMQRYFLDKGSGAYIPSASATLPGIRSLMDVFLRNKLPVILTRHLDDPSDTTLMTKWWKEMIREEDSLSEIIPELNHPDALIIKKTQYDAFYRTSLDDFLEGKRISQIILTGVVTHLCCETTARSAFVKGYTVFFPVDGTATYKEKFHLASFLNLSHGFVIPSLCKEFHKPVESLKQ